MQIEPSGEEGLRTLITKDETGSPAIRARIAGVLVVLGLLVGIGVGARMGSVENPPASTTPAPGSATALPSVSAARPTPSASAVQVFDEQLANRSNTNAGRFVTAPDGFADGSVVLASDASASRAGFAASDPIEGEDALRRDGEAASPGPGVVVVAQYAPVPIESLPVHRPEVESRPGESLTLVTRGAIGEGESLGSSLRRQGISASTVHLIATEMRKVFDFRRSRPGDRYRLGQDSDGRVLDFRYAQGQEESFYLAWEGTRYVVRKETAELRPQIAKIAGIVDSSFYGAILALGEQSALASEFARILAWDIDFSRNVHPGDEFSILYERLYRRNDDGEEVYVRPGRILAGRYSGNVGDYTVVYFEDAKGKGAYFRPDGSSVERAFLAAPLEFSRISSRFTRARRHPILNVTRPHPGIDYAAPHGTPIWAVAGGVVEYRARAGGSGNLVRIRHPGGYTSHYAHLASFAKGLEVGDTVEQKQVIGYVGSTGLSTGPHVCFRVKKDGRYVDPLKISSPAGSPVDGDLFRDFQNVRDQLLADLGPGPMSLADEAL